MPMTERPEEARARRLVDEHAGLALTYADHLGFVDYVYQRAHGRHGALEVSRYTSSAARRGYDQWQREQQHTYQAKLLTKSWTLVVEGDPDYKDLPRRVEPALEVLEQQGIDRLQMSELTTRSFIKQELRPAAALLRANGVTTGQAFEHDAAPSIDIGRGVAGTSAGSDAAVAEILDYVRTTPDNLKKLEASGAEERHLFLWLDDESPSSAARPLQGGRADRFAHFGLPAESPALPAAVTHLWIVYQPTGRGWYWDGAQWSTCGTGHG